MQSQDSAKFWSLQGSWMLWKKRAIKKQDILGKWKQDSKARMEGQN